jgi:hypothetical protein
MAAYEHEPLNRFGLIFISPMGITAVFLCSVYEGRQFTVCLTYLPGGSDHGGWVAEQPPNS